jgi:hypothetical protein
MAYMPPPTSVGAAKTMQDIIESRVAFFEGEVQKLKILFEDTLAEEYSKKVSHQVQYILVELSLEFSTCAKTRLGTLRIPYQLTILDSHLGYLRDLRNSLNTFIYSDR